MATLKHLRSCCFLVSVLMSFYHCYQACLEVFKSVLPGGAVRLKPDLRKSHEAEFRLESIGGGAALAEARRWSDAARMHTPKKCIICQIVHPQMSEKVPAWGRIYNRYSV